MLVVAFNYGARQEIARAAQRLAMRSPAVMLASALLLPISLQAISMRRICRILI